MKKMNERNNGNLPPNYAPYRKRDSSGGNNNFPGVNEDTRIPNTEYSQILQSYQHVARKERSIQIIAGLFAFFSTLIELIVFTLVRRLLNFKIPIHILSRFIAIFVVLLIINIFSIAQLVIIFRWNQNVDKAKLQRQTLATANYKMIGQISVIQIIIILILILNLVFFWFYRQYPGPTRPSQNRLVLFWRIYTALRRLTWLLIFSYTIFEMFQLSKWIKRKNAVSRMELKILEELPKLNELAELIKNNDDDWPVTDEDSEFNPFNQNNREKKNNNNDEIEGNNKKDEDGYDNGDNTYFQRN